MVSWNGKRLVPCLFDWSRTLLPLAPTISHPYELVVRDALLADVRYSEHLVNQSVWLPALELRRVMMLEGRTPTPAH
jgi:hypothetical protein